MANVSAATKLEMDTQVLSFVPLQKTPARDAAAQCHYFSAEDLPFSIYPSDWNLGTLSSLQLPLPPANSAVRFLDAAADATATSQPSLHFILYVPAKEQSPLRIRNADGTSLFLSVCVCHLSPRA